MRRRAIRSAVGIAGAAIAMVAGTMPAAAADFSDTFIGFRYSDNYKEPQPAGAPAEGPVAKEIIQLQHVSGYAFGTNFFNVDMLHSNSADSATNAAAGGITPLPGTGGCVSGNCGSGGANEVYVVYRHTLSAGKIFKHDFSNAIIKDFGVTGGFDFNAKNGGIDPDVQKWMAGPSVSFAVPAGFWSASVMWYHEHNHNQFAAFGPPPAATSFTFDDTWHIETAWLIPVSFPGIPAKFQGFSNWTATKGKDYNNNPTRPEWLNEFALLFDVGSLFGKKDTFYAGAGWQYWVNKFGTDHTRFSGAVANPWQIELEAHF